MPSEFTVRSDSVDVEQIMGRIRARIRDKRGVDYTEDEIRELANVTIEKFLDPTRVRSELLDLYLKGRDSAEPGSVPQNFTFTRYQIYKSSRGVPGKVVGGLRLMLSPILKLFINPNSIIHALQSQSLINAHNEHIERLNYALIHNLVLELTRLGIEVRNLKMRVESLSSRLDFNERRARAMENAVQYRPGAGPAAAAAAPARESASQPAPQARREGDQGEGPARGEAQRRRRRRRRGRGGAGGAGQTPQESGSQAGLESEHGSLPPEGGPHGGPGQNDSALPFEPDANQPAPPSPVVPDRDTTDQ